MMTEFSNCIKYYWTFHPEVLSACRYRCLATGRMETYWVISSPVVTKAPCFRLQEKQWHQCGLTFHGRSVLIGEIGTGVCQPVHQCKEVSKYGVVLDLWWHPCFRDVRPLWRHCPSHPLHLPSQHVLQLSHRQKDRQTGALQVSLFRRFTSSDSWIWFTVNT